MAESENALIKASDAEPECQQLLQDGRYVAPMAGLLRFSRPLNCLMSAVGVGIGGGGGVGAAAGGGLAPPLVLAAAAAAALSPRGNHPHQLFHPQEDRIKHPRRPLASPPMTLATPP